MDKWKYDTKADALRGHTRWSAHIGGLTMLSPEGDVCRDEVMAALHLLLSRLYLGLAGRRALDPAEIRLADDLGEWHRRHKNGRLS